MTEIAAWQSHEPDGRQTVSAPVAGLPARISSPLPHRMRLWHRISLRWRILAVFFLATIVAGAVAAVATIYNARHAAQVEITASMHLAERFVREAVERVPPEAPAPAVLAMLTRELSGLRHVRALVSGLGGGWMSLLPMQNATPIDDGAREVPAWFTRLIHVPEVRREMRIGVGGRYIGAVVLIGHAGDEIAEVWENSKNLAGIFFVFVIAVAAILYVALGRVLQPLTSLGKGLQELEKGQFQHRLSRPSVPELADITDRFNALAGRLAAARENNQRLTRRLVSVQDDERRHIATELHDELGPCLFGLKANIASLEQVVEDLPAGPGDRMRDRLRTLGEIADQIQLLNRRLLSRIRPMALGHVPLAELVSGLIKDFERVDATPKIALNVGALAPTYGDSIDLTVYRCIQEGITNAKRHSGASLIVVELEERRADSADDGVPASYLLTLSVGDNGRGLPPDTPWGFGLSGMDQRVRALGGTLTVVEQRRGTRLEISIPLDDNRRRVTPDGQDEEGSGPS